MLEIEAYITKNSNLDHTRPYIGMSSIGDCPRKIITTLRQGVKFDYKSHLNSYRGYKMESIAKEILVGSGVMKPNSERELSAYDGLFKGHTDGETVKGELLEIKSKKKEIFDQIKFSGKIPNRDFKQVQCYMLYGGYANAKVFVLCPETFETLLINVPALQSIEVGLSIKVENLIKAHKENYLPPCDCGYCKN